MDTQRQLTSTDVQTAIEALGLEIQIMTFDISTATAPQAAEAIGTELGSIVKSLCFIIADQPVIVLAAGDQRIDDRKLGTLYDVGRKKVKIADAETTIGRTGYAPGGVPPIGHRTHLPVLIDQTLARFETVYAAAGSANSIFSMPFETLVSITNGRIADVAKD
jgi:Cys-tRNA(Pro) deacylase